MAVDHDTGSVYVGDYYNQVWRYTPSGAYPTESDYTGGLTLTGFSVPTLYPCELAAGAGTYFRRNLQRGGNVARAHL